MPAIKERFRPSTFIRSNGNRASGLPSALSNTGTRIMQGWPGTDDARDSIVSAAQRAAGRARDTVESALDQLPDTLPGGVSVPGRKKKHGPSKLLIAVIILAIGAGGFLAYRRFFGSGSSDYGIEPDWPAQPDYGPKDERENEAQAELDAEQALAARSGGEFGAAPPQ